MNIKTKKISKTDYYFLTLCPKSDEIHTLNTLHFIKIWHQSTLPFIQINNNYIHGMLVHDFVSSRACSVNQYHYESQWWVVMQFVCTTSKTWFICISQATLFNFKGKHTQNKLYYSLWLLRIWTQPTWEDLASLSSSPWLL